MEYGDRFVTAINDPKVKMGSTAIKCGSQNFLRGVDDHI